MQPFLLSEIVLLGLDWYRLSYSNRLIVYINAVPGRSDGNHRLGKVF